jgi:hypothetical protein
MGHAGYQTCGGKRRVWDRERCRELRLMDITKDKPCVKRGSLLQAEEVEDRT